MADFYHRGGNGPTTAGDAVVTATVTALSFFFCWLFVGGGGDFGSGSGSKFNCAARVGSGRVGSDNLGYGPGSGFSFEPVQTSNMNAFSLQLQMQK